ncbi:glycosyltransferase family 2 protein [Flavobacterium sp. N3904]|uniref:glycosyltransferase family 2 protein n=1 Tax=Flavobacterium sp. N3904 TaxID=2986835 RepID=UPI00222447BE|nr:glycosyltransferase [Flavobacterium sp. N3904]
MISVVIRNKNEAPALEYILKILHKVYQDDIDEIILVDNLSTDKSIEIAENFNCRIVMIDDFTYGKAINLGISTANNNLILLLSSHAVPVGNSFFKNSIAEFAVNPSLAGMRYINSYANYKRAIDNNFKVKDGLNFGMMAGCAMVNKKVWYEFKFDETLVFSEDKEWSDRVLKAGYEIMDFNETFFYHINRDKKGILNRYKNETVAHYQLHKLKYISILKIFGVLFFRIMFQLPKEYMVKVFHEFRLFVIKIKIRRKLLSK